MVFVSVTVVLCFLLLLSALWWRRLRLVWASCWEGLVVGKTGSCSGGQALALSCHPSICWWVGFHSLPGSCLAWGNPALFTGSMVGRTPRGFMPRVPFLAWCCWCPLPCGEPLLTPASTEDPPTLACSWGHCSFPLCLGACKILLVPSKTAVSVSPSPMQVL